MSQNDPDPKWQMKIHQKILDDDPTAFAELCEEIIEPLTQYLLQADNRRDDAVCQTIAHDTLMNYLADPEKYDADRGNLFPYLRMDARGDLKNFLDSEQRKQKKIIEFENSNVEEWLGGRNNIQEEMKVSEQIDELTGQTVKEFFTEFRNKFDDTEWEVIQIWIIEENRTTEAIAQILDIENETIETQRKEVKRFKDKVQKKIIRFGKEKRDNS